MVQLRATRHPPPATGAAANHCAVGSVCEHGSVQIPGDAPDAAPPGDAPTGDRLSTVPWWSRLAAPTPVAATDLAELRGELESAVAAAVGSVRVEPEDLPVRVPKSRLAELARCERSAVASARSTDARRREGPEALGLLRGIALDHFVTHQLAEGRVLEPLPALVSMLTAVADDQSLELLDTIALDDAESTLGPLAGSVAASWADLDPAWMPRTQSRATLVLSGGSVICSGIVDVELGGPTTGLPGVVVEVKSGRPAPEHQAEAYLYALLVALRDGVAPVTVARWYPGSEPAATPVTLGVLEAAAARLTDSTNTWVELVAGRTPDESPGAWCRWCVDAPHCPSARSPDGGSTDGGSTDGGSTDGGSAHGSSAGERAVER